MKKTKGKSSASPKASGKEKVSAILMLLPSTILLAVCSIYPFIWMFRYVCYNYNGFKATYTGTANFSRLASDSTFWKSVGVTFEYAGLKILFIIPLALLIAVILNLRMKGHSVQRGIIFMPTIISSAIAGMIFTFVFATQNGVLNGILKSLHIIKSPVPWISSTDFVMAAVIILAVWGGVGNYMLYFTTGINGISEDCYESAKIDGANGLQTFFYVTLPMLAPVLKTVLMLAITSAFKDYESIMVLTDGGPNNRSMVMFLYIYHVIFGTTNSSAQVQIGYGALLSIVAAVIVGAVTVIYLQLAKKLDKVNG
ncbi:MAG: sugar ABC transporter permease [Lachnospira sp.]|nr:sugar ABC transporter permease [Lachnospira sp.]